jgi:hypothetical protein
VNQLEEQLKMLTPKNESQAAAKVHAISLLLI